jgi:hypothetical protein
MDPPVVGKMLRTRILIVLVPKYEARIDIWEIFGMVRFRAGRAETTYEIFPYF